MKKHICQIRVVLLPVLFGAMSVHTLAESGAGLAAAERREGVRKPQPSQPLPRTGPMPVVPSFSSLRSLMRPDRPRLFLNEEMWPAMRERALGEGKRDYERMQNIAKGLPPLEDIEALDITASVGSRGKSADSPWGSSLAPTAFVYRMTGEKVLLEKIKKMLQASLDQYDDAYSKCKTWTDARKYGVSHADTRISWLAAIDWVWNDLEPAERLKLASGMVRSLHSHMELYPLTRGWFGSHYAADNLYWYAGVALLDKDLEKEDYERALRLLNEGYRNHQQMLEIRGGSRLDDGALRPRMEYTMAAYPHAEWKFFHSWRAAIGTEIPQEWRHSALMPNHAFWNLLPRKRPGDLFRHFGLGQAWHNPAYVRPGTWMSAFGGYLAQHIYFYEESDPEMANLSRYLWQKMDYPRTGKYGSIPFGSAIWSPVEKTPLATLPENLPLARHFEGNGTILMRSGSGPKDTYALFNAGGGVDCSSHFDATHFAIYKQGFLALDSGTRNSLPHSTSYWSQTVAHNCVLIQMPGEDFSVGYGSKTDVNAGGQNRKPEFARTLAFETHPLFAYAASDATATYHADKCKRMLRQFLFLPPDYFVVFDKFVSQKGEYPKTWLLHTSNEPVIKDKEFYADQGGGRIFCRTVYPLNAKLEKIGGPGKEFWADGKNWPLNEDWWQRFGHGLDRKIPEMMGRWRVEVTEGTNRYLHLIQASDQSVQEMVESEMNETAETIEVKFSVGARDYSIALNKWEISAMKCGGHIRIVENGKVLVDRDLTHGIMPQAGLAPN